MGIAWNNIVRRFLLSPVFGSEIIILLENGMTPNRTPWEAEWIGGTFTPRCRAFSLIFGFQLFDPA
jgi:hypothetical protein